MSNIPELINQVYNFTGGDVIYKDALESSALDEQEAVLFVNELYERCSPVAALADIGPVRLAWIADKIIKSAKREGLYDRLIIVNFIYRMLISKYRKSLPK